MAKPIAAIQKSVIVISWSLAHVLVRAGHNDNTEGIVRIFWIACLFAVAVVAPTQRAAWGQEIRISHQWTEGTDGRDRALRVFVQEAEARVKGLKFRIYPNSSLNIKPTELFSALQKNTLDMAVYPLTYAIASVPEFSLAGLPGLVPDLDAAHALKGTEIHGMLQSLAEANGMRILTWWWAPGALFAKDRQIAGPATVRGLKMRGADPLFELMLKEAGAMVTNMLRPIFTPPFNRGGSTRSAPPTKPSCRCVSLSRLGLRP